jgi:biopolymer transport protein ExbD
MRGGRANSDDRKIKALRQGPKGDRMAISVKGDSADPMVEPNVIPLVDIMLVLLIIFIITIPVMTHAVKIDLPRDNPNPPTEPPPVVKVYVEFDGTIYWNGAPVDQQTFRDYVAIENAKDPQPEVHVDAHRRVPYVYVANVLFTLQRGGLQKVGFVSGEGPAGADAAAPAPTP